MSDHSKAINLIRFAIPCLFLTFWLKVNLRGKDSPELQIQCNYICIIMIKSVFSLRSKIFKHYLGSAYHMLPW